MELEPIESESLFMFVAAIGLVAFVAGLVLVCVYLRSSPKHPEAPAVDSGELSGQGDECNAAAPGDDHTVETEREPGPEPEPEPEQQSEHLPDKAFSNEGSGAKASGDDGAKVGFTTNP